jgi:SPX domain protein involved in polyphosphate accumulation
MSPSTFVRETRDSAAELKFLVSLSTAEELKAWARANLRPDPHAGGEHGDTYYITSLYFDTEAFDVFNRRGSYGRSKLRIRRYGDSESTFLERKLRTKRMLTKRRSTIGLGELARLSQVDEDPMWPGRLVPKAASA